MTLDLTLAPLYRINGQEPASLPGLLAVSPPRKVARGREQDRLIVYLLLTGNASFTTAEYMQLASGAAAKFYQSPGTLTSALRAATEAVNQPLIERNMSTSGRGQYAIGWLALAALRESHCTILLSGPVHTFILGQEARQIYDPGLSGKGLGLAQNAAHYFTQVELQPNDRILLMGKVPSAWESTLTEGTPASLDATRRRLLTLTSEDLHAVLMQATTGKGALNLLRTASEPRAEVPHAQTAPIPAPIQTPSLTEESTAQPEPEPEPDSFPAHVVQPSAYAIPPQPEKTETPPATSITNMQATTTREFPPSIPRAKPKVETSEPQPAMDTTSKVEEPPTPREPSMRTRQAAKAAVNGMQTWRRGTQRLNDGLRKFLPRLFPGNESGESHEMPAYMMTFIALVVPLIVVTIAFVVYQRYGRSVQYQNYLAQAQNARKQAINLTDPVMQRDAWQSVLLYVANAEKYRTTDETNNLQNEAQGKLDQLLGITRLQFQPAFSSGLNIPISRLAANETDLYLLDARTGEVLRAQLTDHGFQMDNTFNCKPGPYGSYQVGPLVDILALPLLNSVNATVLGIDAAGNLLYCAPGQVPQAIPLPPPDTNWGRVTSFTIDSGNLYVLDAPSRAVWVYTGKDSAFVDRPYFFFGGQIPEIQDSIDIAVSGDDLYLLHADGHLSHCSYSRLETVPTRCDDPAPFVNPFAAYKGIDLFAQSHLTQMQFTPAPDSSILLLDSDNQGVWRVASRSLELQNQFRPTIGAGNPLPSGRVGAMTAGPNHVLYLAIKDQVYFSANLP